MILAGVVAEERRRGAPPVFITSAKASGASAGTSAINTTGASLLVAVLVAYAVNPTAPTDSAGNPWVQIPTTYGTGGSGVRTTIWYCYSPTTSATHQFFNPSSAYASGIYLAFSGTLQTSGVFGAYNGQVVSATPFQTGSVTPSPNDVIIAGCGEDGFLTSAAIDSGFTTNASLAQTNSASEVSAAAYLISPGAAPVNPTFTVAGAGAVWAAAIACFHGA